MGSFAFLLERLDIIAKQLSPGMAAGAIVCSIYWSAITFGAVTVLQTTGFERGLSMMEQAEPIALLLCLPTIPVLLVIGRMFRWEDIVLRFLQNRQFDVRKYPVISLMLPVSNEPSPRYPEPYPSSTITTSEPLCDAHILWRTIAAHGVHRRRENFVQIHQERFASYAAWWICVRCGQGCAENLLSPEKA